MKYIGKTKTHKFYLNKFAGLKIRVVENILTTQRSIYLDDRLKAQEVFDLELSTDRIIEIEDLSGIKVKIYNINF